MNDNMRDKKVAAYHQRFERVFDYIDQHLDEPLTVERLSQIAYFSKYHFHRQFAEVAGINVSQYIQWQRLKRAAYQLSFRHQWRVLDIALQAGFESAESFARAFKKACDQSPSQFRKQPNWTFWQPKFHQLSQHRVKAMSSTQLAVNPVNIIEFPTTKVAVLEHRGDPQAIFNTVYRFIEWRKLNHLPPSTSKTFNIFYNDPTTTEPQQFHMDICASIKADVDANNHGVITKTIPGGRCAVLRHIGNDQNLNQSFEYLYGTWLPQSGETERDFPPFLHRVTLFPDVSEQQTITDIYLPLL